jgi:putative NADH-flavin reductase
MSSPSKPERVLVLGATGPAGVCLLRELLHRQHYSIAYVRNPSKVPADLAANPLLEVCACTPTRPLVTGK